MSTIIQYNGIIVASGQPMPFVGKSNEMIRYGERWANKTTITLQGSLTGCTYEKILSAQSALINNFSSDFYDLKIFESASQSQQENTYLVDDHYQFITTEFGNNLIAEGLQTIFSGQQVNIFTLPMAQVRSINFAESKYVGLLSYTVTLEGFERSLFSGIYGVLEPSDSWSFEDEKDGLVRITHDVSAKGFNTAGPYSNAFENAKTFVLARTGWNAQAVPTFTSGISAPCIVSQGEKIGRFDGSYGVTEQYLYDPYAGGSCTSLRYSTEYDCNVLEGKTSVVVRGTIQGGLNTTVSGLRAQYQGVNTFNLAQTADLSSSINNNFLSRTVTEDVTARKLTFEVVYDNLPYDSNGIAFDYSTQVDTDDDELTKVAVNGTLRGRGDLKTRWDRMQSYVSQIRLFDAAQSGYVSAVSYANAIPLNPFFLASGRSYNKFGGEIGLNASFDNRPIPTNPNFTEINYTQSANVPVQQISQLPIVPDCGKNYFIVDLGYQNRAEFSLEGSAKTVCGIDRTVALNALKSYLDGIRSTEANGSRLILTKHEFTTSDTTAGFDIKFGCTWTFEHSGATNPANYASIGNLSVA